jgi:hypothetical protein
LLQQNYATKSRTRPVKIKYFYYRLVYGSRKIPERIPNLLSNKEIFDWEANENGEETKPVYNTGKNKFIVKGIVYQNENNLNVLYNPKKRICHHPDNNDMLSWNENVNNRRAKNNSIDLDIGSTYSSSFIKREQNFSVDGKSILSATNSPAVKKVKCNLFKKPENSVILKK